MSDLMDVDGPLTESQEGQGAVEDIKFQLPMSYDYEQSTFFVRSCYPVYYELIVDLLKGRDTSKTFKYITLTGTPGIGKSVFYIYFFQRWKTENPQDTIVTASFNKDRKLEKCVVFIAGATRGDIYPTIPLIAGAFYLYDGPPELRTPDNQMVCFTSPNPDWYDSIVKSPTHKCFYMPVWTVEELLEADRLLRLNLGKDTLARRFHFFGGSARFCLATDDDYVKDSEENLLQKVDEITHFEMIPKIAQSKAPRDLCHRIFHVVPKLRSALPTSYSLIFCSRLIANKVYQSVQDFSDAQRARMVGWVRSENPLASVVGAFFEIYASCVLSQGGQFAAMSISDEQVRNVTIELPKDQYLKSSAKNTESVDGHWHDSTTGILYLFQCTVSQHHPVNANGIINLIEKVDLQHISADLVRLVFVVPDDQEIRKQSVVFNRPPLPGTAAVSLIHGIGPALNEKLVSQNILTVADLQQAIELDERIKSEFSRKLESALLASSKRTKFSFLANITQLVLKIDFARSKDTRIRYSE